MKFFEKVSVFVFFLCVLVACNSEEMVDIDCEEFSVERTNISCNSFNFQSNSISTNPEWFVITHPDPDLVYIGNNSGLDFDPTEPGNYSIIAVYENENCPEGTTVGFDVDVDASCFADIDCEEFSVERTNISCNSFNFQSNATSTNPEWFVITHPDPDMVFLGNNSGLDFDPTEPGNYSIIAVYENENCPEGTTVGFDVDVEASCFVDIDCEEFSVERTNISCNTFNFQSNAMSTNPEWFVITHPDPDMVYLGNNSGLDFDPTEPGNYSIIAVYENENCPEGTTVGFDVDVDASCFVDIDCEEFWVERSDISCNSFNFQSNAMSTNPEWYVIVHPDPDMIYLGNNSGLDFDPTEPGNYSIIAVYENENCPEGVTIGFDVDVDASCFVDIDCEEFWVERSDISCNSFNFQSNAMSTNPEWYVIVHPDPDMIYLGNNSGLDFDPTEPGNYSIIAVYENENCPEGTTIGFDVDVYEDCFE